MKTKLAVTTLLAIFSCQAHATNWLQLQGNEAPDAPAFKAFGFIQPTYTYINANPVAGLQGAAAAFNGQYAANNLNWPNLRHPQQFQIFR
ncbi:MAG TPA: hypothetical protein VFW53_03690, partial [Gallionella sp.]|nr:hypothetical protein [Gallionella sp.]